MEVKVEHQVLCMVVMCPPGLCTQPATRLNPLSHTIKVTVWTDERKSAYSERWSKYGQKNKDKPIDMNWRHVSQESNVPIHGWYYSIKNNRLRIIIGPTWRWAISMPNWVPQSPTWFTLSTSWPTYSNKRAMLSPITVDLSNTTIN